jgi:starch-binding outer membrane protein, SusD/RagB family
MKSHPFKIIALTAIVIVGVSCEDVLDKHDLTTLDDRIWEDATSIELYINNLYVSNMPGVSFGHNSQLTDETYSSSTQYNDLLYGFVTESDINEVTVFHKEKYQLIRKINIALEGIEGSSIADSIKGVLAGQALFFRAYRYWEMVQLYGGIPIVKEVQDPYEGSEALDVPRSKTGVAIDEIVEDLDEAIDGLPGEWTLPEDQGRITCGAAAAFKGRVLLAWASPMFNPNNDPSRWQRAYDANKEAMERLSQMRQPRALYPEFSAIFTTNVLENQEAILFRRYSLAAGNAYTNNWEDNVRPYSGGGSSGFTPTWELVKAFPMANGKLIHEPGSGYDSARFWLNRDPRFYATIAYNGSEWTMSGRDETNVWTFRNSKEANRVPVTGFYNRKATDPTLSRENIGQSSTAWIELRYAEVLLNTAECANELGYTDEALTYIRAIRERAGIEPGDGGYGIANSVSKEMLRQIIMVERQVEFAFENKRYWDLRRRKMFREDLGPYVKKLNGMQRHGLSYRALSGCHLEITDESSPYHGKLRIDTALMNGSLDLNDESSFSKYFTYSVRNLDTYQGQSVVFDYRELYDFFAVPSSMLNKSPAVEQTLGWINGTFDPLAE